jgi:hypothetical protein
MKKCSLVLFAMLLSSALLAQVKTGGGGSVIPPEASDDTSSLEAKPTFKKIQAFTTHLKEQESFCPNDKKLIQDTDMLQIYLKLSLYKSAASTTGQCDDVNRYFACLGDPKSKKYAKELKDSPDAVKVLREKYKIDEKEAKKILQFFYTLDSKVDNFSAPPTT